MHRIFRSNLTTLIIVFLINSFTNGQYLVDEKDSRADWDGGRPQGCTVITVGKDASFDGSVMNSHTCDSHRTRAWFDLVPPKDHQPGDKVEVVKRFPSDSLAMPTYKYEKTGEIDQVEHTYGYINTAYPSMNQHQLAVGESTFGGREELKSDKGLFDCQAIIRVIMQRCTTARDAIELAGKMLEEHGWNDYGECITISDPQEVWHMEIVGPGKDKVGAVWVAQRVPDGHVSVNANASRICEIDLDNSDYFMASENIYDVAIEQGWWDPDGEEEFRFNYVYDPDGRRGFAGRRREWRVLSLMAPSLDLNPNGENFPFSVKPDDKVTLEKMVDVFQDYYEGTPYNPVKTITQANEEGECVISPFANPFMPYGMNKLFGVNGGWNWRGERTIARWYTMYATILQSRDWLPDEVGGIVWLAYDNIATSIYVPVYSSVTDLPEPFKTPGRVEGYNRDCAWWAFNRLGTLAAQRWGDMRHDVTEVWAPMQTNLFEIQKDIDKKIPVMLEEDRDEAIEFLTNHTIEWGNKVVDRAWKLGDMLWTKYDEKF